MSKTLLLLHGALGSASQMQPLAAKFSIPTVCPDLLGHGVFSVENTAYAIDAFAKQLVQDIDAPVNIFGYSLGGYVALYLAAFFPDKVGKIVTLATKFDWTPESAAKEVRMLNPQKIKEKVPAFAAQLAQRHGVYWPEVVHRTGEMMLALGAAPALSVKLLRQVHAPVLMLRGELDAMVDEHEMRWAASHIPHAQFRLLQGQPHAFEKTDLALIALQIEQFLNEGSDA